MTEFELEYFLNRLIVWKHKQNIYTEITMDEFIAYISMMINGVRNYG